MTMTTDNAMTETLRLWQAPPPSATAMQRILAAATPQSQVLRSDAPQPMWRRFKLGGPAVAAALLLGVLIFVPHEILPKNDPVLQQSALKAFSIQPSGADAEDAQ